MAERPLDVALYRRAREVFADLDDLTGAAREAALAQATRDAPELRALVERLLHADARPHVTEADPDDPGPPTPRDGVPEVLGRFRILRELGRGGMGVVYEAEQEAPRRKVAVKTLLPLRQSRRAREQFRTEVDALGRVLHPGIPQVYEVFDTPEGVPAMAMELVDGAPLLQAVYLLDPEQRAEMLARLCDAVDHAHRRGVIHRDLKPDNVLVTAAGQPKVLDFGIARLGEDFLPRAGTLAYLAPEQLEGAEPDVAADVYGLGAVGWEMMTGSKAVVPLRGEPVKVLAARKREPLDDPPGVPPAVLAVLRRALDPTPQARFGSARAMARALRDLAAPVEAGEAHADAPVDLPPTATHPALLPALWFCAGAACASAVWALAGWLGG